MKKFGKSIVIMLVILLSLTCTLALTACGLSDLDEIISDDGKVSSNDVPNNVIGDITYEQYDVTTSSGVPVESGSSYTEMINAVQTSVVVIRTASDLTSDVAEAGAGVIYGCITGEDASMIITCCHVVDGAKKIQVAINDGDFDRSNDLTLDATVIGMDDEQDIAVLKISGSDYNYVEYRDTTAAPLKLGEEATAIGNPLGAGITVTKGIISGVGRSVYMDGITMALVQTDAAINGGNSGGALFDASGYLIGIVNAKLTGSSIDGVGYAIPVKAAVDTANSIISTAGNPDYNGLGYIDGKIRLGLTLAKLNKASLQSDYTNIPSLPGDGEYYYYINSINAYGSVYKSDSDGKIMQGILIKSITVGGEEKAITASYDAGTILAQAHIGDVITLNCIRPTKTSYWGPMTYSTFSLNVTLCQYVYGFIG